MKIRECERSVEMSFYVDNWKDLTLRETRYTFNFFLASQKLRNTVAD